MLACRIGASSAERCEAGRRSRLLAKDRFDRAGGARADVDRARGCRVQALGPVGRGKPEDAETRAEPLLVVRALVEKEVAQGTGRRANCGGVLADAHDDSVGIAAMARGHVFRHGGVPWPFPDLRSTSDVCFAPILLQKSIDRDRGTSRDATPPTPPGIRVRTAAVRLS